MLGVLAWRMLSLHRDIGELVVASGVRVRVDGTCLESPHVA